MDVEWCLYSCVSAYVRACARAVSLAGRRVLFPVFSEGAKFRHLVVCLQDIHEAQTLGKQLIHILDHAVENSRKKYMKQTHCEANETLY